MKNIQWKKTAQKGLRYYEHETRRHGKKRDRYYSIRFKVAGRDYTCGVGWLSDGIPEAVRKAEPGLGFEDYCLKLLRQYKGNVKTGTGPKSPKQKRAIAEAREAAEREARAQAEADNVTFGYYFENVYYPTFQVGRKISATRKAKEHFKNWLEPVIGQIPLKDVKPFALEKVKKNLLDAGRAPRTLQYVMATFRQIWNMARRDGLITGDTPTRSIKKPKVDNRRVRFLSHKEADLLLSALQGKDTTAYNMALLSLHTGLRMGEIVNLKWCHIDTERGIIRVMNPKGGVGRAAFMTDRVKAMFEGLTQGEPEGLIFTSATGKPLKEMPRIFFEVVADLKFNEGITDARQKVVAHTLRHTFASWHVTAGTDIYSLKELLGHSVIAMTERYSHLAPATLQNATKTLERAIESAEQEKGKEQSGQVVNFLK
jgi:integrase